MPGNNTDERTENNRRFTDEQTDKRIHEHLTNDKDEITEADIANVKTDESVTKANDREKLDVDPVVDGGADKEEDSNNSNNIETSWNILDT